MNNIKTLLEIAADLGTYDYKAVAAEYGKRHQMIMFETHYIVVKNTLNNWLNEQYDYAKKRCESLMKIKEEINGYDYIYEL